LLEKIEAETTIPPEAREMMALLGEEIARLDARLKEMDTNLKRTHNANPDSKRRATAPGIGSTTALTVVTTVDPDAFESGRHFSAWVGLTPKEHSTGGKPRMGGISRAGNERLRQLFVLGAMSVIKAAVRAGGQCTDAWLLDMLRRKPRKVVAVALANKMARRCWAMLKRGEAYQPARHARSIRFAAQA
jgi:transposase